MKQRKKNSVAEGDRCNHKGIGYDVDEVKFLAPVAQTDYIRHLPLNYNDYG